MAATPDHTTTTLFEFYSDSTSEMCAAEDIFLRGRLLPYRPPQTTEEEQPKPTTHHRKTESFDESNRGSAKGRFLKAGSSSSSLEYQKLQRARSERPPPPPASAAKPNWYWIVFGSVKLPGEMEMRDIRSRQRRRQPPPPLPLSSEGRKTALGKSGNGWRLLKSLSCKGHDDISNVV
ncbi:hypothetical protein QJS04_geneDACA013882 [Acorus gramineus]|uniref:Uncharacterized protein n=1 Tax=Acorus gramineus TaxID=55184 RepID=A0AAV9AVY7_ACOGR|nr:hypothetical protein QJS04_geneDACA013882 [Acorus gramineus]